MERCISLNDVDTGYTDVVTHDINLNEGNAILLPHRRIRPNIYSEVREHMHTMLNAGHIRPSKSLWSFMVVRVRK